nr:EOG090X0FGQ [Polyphemus pediculus]
MNQDLRDKVVLVLWGSGNSPESLQQFTDIIKSRNCSAVVVENVERLVLSSHPNSAFDFAFSNIVEPFSIKHTFELLMEIIRILKPNGSILANDLEKDKLISNLKITGFTSISEQENSGFLLSACKPNFEIGSSSKLSFGGSAALSFGGSAAVWSLADSLIDDQVELINEDDLLDSDDLIKPASDSLKVCGTTGKRKACKDCSCGLAEELEAEGGTVIVKSATSSCGSCYLGDAFRCASCPYLGMPAFKPGEKIQLSDRQLNPDN